MVRLSFFIIICTFLACHSSKQMEIEELPEFSYLEPISYIYQIDKRGNEYLNDSLSTLNRDLVDDLFSRYSNDRIYIESDSMHYNMLQAIEMMIEDGMNGIPTRGMQLSKEVQPILNQSKHLYTLGLLADGFVVDKKKYRKEMALWTTLSILSLGSVAYVPPKNGSHLYGVLINNSTRQVTAFRFDQRPYRDPMNQKKLSKQVQKLIKRIGKSYYQA